MRERIFERESGERKDTFENHYENANNKKTVVGPLVGSSSLFGFFWFLLPEFFISHVSLRSRLCLFRSPFDVVTMSRCKSRRKETCSGLPPVFIKHDSKKGG